MISVFINSLTSGGAEKVVLTLIDRFKHSGQQLELLMIERVRFYDLPEEVSSKYLTNFESLEKGPLKFPYLFICAWRLKNSIRQPTQIIQSHLLRASFINIIAKMLGSKHHAQIVIHSRINFDHKPFYYRAFAKWVYRNLFKRADSVISICEMMKNDLDDYLDLKDHPKHLAIHNPHNLEEIQQKAKEEPINFTFNPGKKYIISIGRLVAGKRIDDLVQAFANINQKIPDAELIILGDGDLNASLQHLAEQLNISKKVHFTGFQQNPFAFLSHSDVLVLSSEWEGLPNILIESMACGTAVISADCISGPREIIHPESDLSYQLNKGIEYGTYGLLYPVGDIEQLSQCLEKILKDEHLKAKFEQKGLQRAQDFDKSKIASKYLKSFQ